MGYAPAAKKPKNDFFLDMAGARLLELSSVIFKTALSCPDFNIAICD